MVASEDDHQETSKVLVHELPHKTDSIARKRINTDYEASNDAEPFKGRKVVGIDGVWYDITEFIKKHPGGPVIEKFIGKDATEVFHAYRHPTGILKSRRQLGTYTRQYRHPVDREMEELIRLFEAKGFYETDWLFYAKKVLLNISIISAVFYLVICCKHWSWHYLGAVLLALFWQQCGFIMHELMHCQLFKDRETNRFFALIFGTIPFGVSSHWWHDEHVIHHGLTNVVSLADRFVDPQMWEVSWAQNEKLFPLFTTAIHYLFIKIQHFTFIPFVVCIGRMEILMDSYLTERRLREWICMILHWIWVAYLLSHLPSYSEMFTFYFIAANVEGFFHFQLILSHYCRAFAHLDEFYNMSWYQFMILSNMNIDVPWWQYWMYGGLNWHIEHHLFPKMSRRYLGEAAKLVEPLCKKHGIEYSNEPFSRAIVLTLTHLKTASKHFKLDPR